MYKYFLIILSVLFLIVGCKEPNKNSNKKNEVVINQINQNWLVGNWVYSDENGALHEDWELKNDSLLIGKSYLINKNDTVFYEQLQLRLYNDSMYYENIPTEPLNKKVKVYKGRYNYDNYLKVENLEHSFPRSISYNQLNDTLLMIEISGFIDGSEETQPYEMVRVK